MLHFGHINSFRVSLCSSWAVYNFTRSFNAESRWHPACMELVIKLEPCKLQQVSNMAFSQNPGQSLTSQDGWHLCNLKNYSFRIKGGTLEWGVIHPTCPTFCLQQCGCVGHDPMTAPLTIFMPTCLHPCLQAQSGVKLLFYHKCGWSGAEAILTW